MKIHDVFNISLLKQDNIKKGYVNQNLSTDLEPELKADGNKKYKIEII